MKKVFILLAALVVFALPVYAEEVVFSEEGFIGSVTYEPSEPVVGDLVSFTFDLYDDEADQIFPFDNVWIELSKDGRVLFTGTIAEIEAWANFEYEVQEGGEYTISYNYYSDELSIIDGSVNFVVQANTNWNMVMFTCLFIFIIFGFVLLLVYRS